MGSHSLRRNSAAARWALAALAVAAAVLLAWWRLEPGLEGAAETLTVGSSAALPSWQSPASIGPVPDGGEARTAVQVEEPLGTEPEESKEPKEPDLDVEGQPESFVALSGVLATHVGSEFIDVTEFRQIGARITIGERAVLLPVPVTRGGFELRFVRQPNGEYALPNGTRPIGILPVAEDQGEITLFAPKISRVGDGLGFLVPEAASLDAVSKSITLPLGSTNVVVTLAAPPRVRLFAFDRRTGEALDDIDVYRAGAQDVDPPGFGSSTRPVAVNLDHGDYLLGKIGSTESADLETKKRGFAPARFQADFGSGGEIKLSLDRGATLVVRVQGAVPLSMDAGLVVKVGSSSAYKTAQVTRERELVFKDLVAGRSMVRLELQATARTLTSFGAGSRSPEVDRLIDMREVLLESGGETQVTLRSDAEAALAHAPLSGTILVPNEWTERAQQLAVALHPTQGQDIEALRFRTEVARLSADDGTGLQEPGSTASITRYPFDAGTVPPGAYVLVVEALPTFGTVMVPPSGKRNMEVLLAGPVNHRVRVLEKESGAIAEIGELRVDTAGLEEWLPTVQVTKAPGAEEFAFRRPDVATRVWPTAGAQYWTQSLVIQPGMPGPHVLQVQRVDGDAATGLTLPLRGFVR
ncbi:hypothetical protein Poly30_20560 [Planctomycetes bacterium Poly30]|uniref:Uncharacterized protein n=1 Tax=Saltatorellus ferox TaxID=2528018 RepID=A0A518ER23_9BACT|nr:hypothetical protein Poly30_20560 [Planctomycetes bacterium Poly30]